MSSQADGKPNASPRFVELVRVSSKGQADKDTPELQKRALDCLRQVRGGTLIERICPPAGLSGALPLEQRPDIQRLKVIASEGGFDELRVYALDRLTRAEDPRERLEVLGIVRDAGGVIVDASGTVCDPHEMLGELNYFLQTLFAKEERKKILKRTADGRKRVAAMGRVAVGAVPWGYKRLNDVGEYILDEGVKDLVNRIYREAISGRSILSIAKRLNAEGLPSPRGVRWSAAHIRNTLLNPAYKGEFRQRLSGELFVARIPSAVEPGTWETAQSVLKSRRSLPSRPLNNTDALCRGLLVCGVCARSMHTRRRKSAKYVYYQCASDHATFDGSRCGNLRHPVGLVDEVVWSMVHSKLRSPTLLVEAAGLSTPSSVQLEREQWEQKSAASDERLKSLNEDEKTVLSLLSRKLLSMTAAEERLAEIQRHAEETQRSLDIARRALAQRTAIEATLGKMEEKLATIRRRLDSTNFATQRELVSALIPAHLGFGITLYRDRRVEIRGAIDFDSPHAPVGNVAMAS